MLQCANKLESIIVSHSPLGVVVVISVKATMKRIKKTLNTKLNGWKFSFCFAIAIDIHGTVLEYL